MPRPVDLPEPTARFAQLAALAPGELPLAEAALLVAAHDHPVDVAAQLARLDDLAAGIDHGDLGHLLARLFVDEGFTGDTRDYHHADNSFLDRVLDRRRGLPILLSLVAAEVGARAGCPLAPVAMPGHFLLRVGDDPDRFVDPFAGGAVLDRAGVARIFARLHGGAEPPESSLRPVPDKVVLARLVANLVHTYRQRGPVTSLAWALQLRALVVGGPAWADAARAREVSGQWELAADSWDRAAEAARTAADAALAEQRAVAARAHAN